jgi:hypothetical protein
MANEVFGFGQWGYDLLNVELVNVVGEDGQIVGGYYAARVRLTSPVASRSPRKGFAPFRKGATLAPGLTLTIWPAKAPSPMQ